MNTQDTLLARQSVHGDFTDNANVTEQLMEFLREAPNWKKLTAVQKVGLFQIQHKIARIMCGDYNHPDHWHDIGGYAKCVEDRLPSNTTPLMDELMAHLEPDSGNWWFCKCGRKDVNPPAFDCLSCNGPRQTHEQATRTLLPV